MSMIIQIGSFSGFVNGESPELPIKKENMDEIAAHIISLTPVYSKTEIENASICGKFLEKLINGVYYTFACPTKLIYCSLANALLKVLNLNKQQAPVIAELSEETKLQLQSEIDVLKNQLDRMKENKILFQSSKILLILEAELKLKNDPSIRKLIEALENQEEDAEDEALKFIFPSPNH